MKRCVICAGRIWPWYYKYRAAKLEYRNGETYHICSDKCYMTLFAAYEEGMAFVYVDDPDWN